jgi:hypothetical protein
MKRRREKEKVGMEGQTLEEITEQFVSAMKAN